MIKYHTSKIKLLHCASCAGNIEENMLAVDGIKDIKINYTSGTLKVWYDPSKLNLTSIKAKLDKLGLQILESEVESGKIVSIKNREFVFALISGIALFTGLGFLFLTSDPVVLDLYYRFNISELFFAAAMIFGGYHVAKSSIKGLLNKRFVIDSLMLIGAAGAVLIGEFAEGAAVLFLFSLAELLEDYSVERSRNSLRELLDLTPKTVRKKKGKSFHKVPVDEVEVDDIIRVKPGERIGADGVCVLGESSVNQAPITGEFMPVSKCAGDDVFAGTINQHGLMDVKVTRSAKDSTLAKIIALVEAAEEQKAPTERFIDRFAKYYTPAVLLLAVSVVVIPVGIFKLSFDVWFYKALLLLLISCPCALALSTPIAMASGITSGARNGVLFKGGVNLEKLARVDTFAFDKTGTLTEGRPAVTESIHGRFASKKELIGIAAGLEKHSSHPLGKAVVELAIEKKIKPKGVKEFKSIPGKGIKGRIGNKTYFAGSKLLFDSKTLSGWEKTISRLESTGQTLVIVGMKSNIIGVIGISDKIRDGADQAVKDLGRLGIKRTVMITGDNKGTARSVAEKIGIDEYHGELLPGQKVEFVRKMVNGKRTVAMVGDGINDAPALASAELGIAMGAAGSDTAMEVADIALMDDDIRKVPYLVSLGRKTMEVVKQNIALAIGIKLLFAILVFPGLVTLWMAVAIGDMGVSLGVILNAFRLSTIKNQ